MGLPLSVSRTAKLASAGRSGALSGVAWNAWFDASYLLFQMDPRLRAAERSQQ